MEPHKLDAAIEAHVGLIRSTANQLYENIHVARNWNPEQMDRKARDLILMGKVLKDMAYQFRSTPAGEKYGQ